MVPCVRVLIALANTALSFVVATSARTADALVFCVEPDDSQRAPEIEKFCFRKSVFVPSSAREQPLVPVGSNRLREWYNNTVRRLERARLQPGTSTRLPRFRVERDVFDAIPDVQQLLYLPESVYSPSDLALCRNSEYASFFVRGYDAWRAMLTLKALHSLGLAQDAAFHARTQAEDASILLAVEPNFVTVVDLLMNDHLSLLARLPDCSWTYVRDQVQKHVDFGEMENARARVEVLKALALFKESEQAEDATLTLRVPRLLMSLPLSPPANALLTAMRAAMKQFFFSTHREKRLECLDTPTCMAVLRLVPCPHLRKKLVLKVSGDAVLSKEFQASAKQIAINNPLKFQVETEDFVLPRDVALKSVFEAMRALAKVPITSFDLSRVGLQNQAPFQLRTMNGLRTLTIPSNNAGGPSVTHIPKSVNQLRISPPYIDRRRAFEPSKIAATSRLLSTMIAPLSHLQELDMHINVIINQSLDSLRYVSDMLASLPSSVQRINLTLELETGDADRRILICSDLFDSLSQRAFLSLTQLSLGIGDLTCIDNPCLGFIGILSQGLGKALERFSSAPKLEKLQLSWLSKDRDTDHAIFALPPSLRSLKLELVDLRIFDSLQNLALKHLSVSTRRHDACELLLEWLRTLSSQQSLESLQIESENNFQERCIVDLLRMIAQLDSLTDLDIGGLRVPPGAPTAAAMEQLVSVTSQRLVRVVLPRDLVEFDAKTRTTITLLLRRAPLLQEGGVLPHDGDCA